MNLKLASLVLALLSLPLTGCGNKGPLVLPQNPAPAEADVLPMLPPMDDVTVPADAEPPATVPPAAIPADDANGDGTPPPPAAGDDGNG